MSEKVTVEILRERLAKIMASDSIEERDKFFDSIAPPLSPETIEVIKIAFNWNEWVFTTSFMSKETHPIEYEKFKQAQAEFNKAYGGGE